MSEPLRSCVVKFFGRAAGEITESDSGYSFVYYRGYLVSEGAAPISVTLPLREEPFETKTLHPFFDGLIPEGWTLDIIVNNWKLDPRDRMGLLMACCKSCIGAASIEAKP
ncbi:HipA N-terminal domain-containing protein [Cloacibacillus evryensis]|uniref:HipA N-terminal domain-containing protein n=1 Tax=Cloacibacillus evryensis TaxID=508460 RepID=UPI00241D12D4|nr:HipA N-terminal domain-containing protein [Cloacibacillus evryensis]